MDQFWAQLGVALMPVLINTLTIILPILATALATLFVQLIRWVQAKIIAENPTGYQKAVEWAKDAVLISEQLGLSKIIDVNSKKKYAVDYLQNLCDKNNVKLDVSVLEDLVEKAVFTELTASKLDWGIPIKNTIPEAINSPETKEVG